MDQTTTTPKKTKKFYGTRRSIVRRTTDDATRVITRHLECDHTVREPNGGEAKNAQFALCAECASGRV